MSSFKIRPSIKRKYPQKSCILKRQPKIFGISIYLCQNNLHYTLLEGAGKYLTKIRICGNKHSSNIFNPSHTIYNLFTRSHLFTLTLCTASESDSLILKLYLTMYVLSIWMADLKATKGSRTQIPSCIVETFRKRNPKQQYS